MLRKILFTLAGLSLAYSAMAQDDTNSLSRWSLSPQVGYTLGGLTPVPLPAEIRKINQFEPSRGLNLGLDLAYRLDKYWSLQLGLRYFDRGMNTEAEVKAYHITVKQNDDYLRGYFTGHNHTQATQQGFSLGLQGVWHAGNRWSFSTGPVIEYYTRRSFTGSVTDGYLRVNTPIGDKILFGPSSDDSPTYDYSSDMARWGLGWQARANYRFAKRWSAFAEGRYVFTNSFVSTFETISMRLHPSFLTLGLAYQIKL